MTSSARYSFSSAECVRARAHCVQRAKVRAATAAATTTARQASWPPPPQQRQSHSDLRRGYCWLPATAAAADWTPLMGT